MNRKRISTALVITLAIAALIGLGARFNVRGDDNYHNKLSGSWEVTVMPTGGDPIIDFATFTDGGGVTNIDPDPNVSTGIGTWERIGPNRFSVTFVHFLSSGGVPLGTLKVRSEGTLNPDTNTLSGVFRTDVVIGGNVVQSICGTMQLKRVNAEPFEACP